MKKEEIKQYIVKHPTRFSNLDYMYLFKITTENRERDDAAIDWIEEILQATQSAKSNRREKESRNCLLSNKKRVSKYYRGEIISNDPFVIIYPSDSLLNKQLELLRPFVGILNTHIGSTDFAL